MLNIKAFLLLAGLIAGTASAANEGTTPVTVGQPERISFLVTFGDEKCPEAAGDEIVVCATAPESERYRIPEELRASEEQAAAGGSWTSAVESLDEHARAGRPNSCSVNGSGGFTGCAQAALRQWFAERRGKLKAD